MSVTSNRKITVTQSQDVEYSQEFEAPVNSAGSGINSLVDLTTGDNTIEPPSGAVAVTIIKPSDNTVALTLKGTGTDVGISLALVGPDSISLLLVSSFVITTDGDVTVRLIYS